MRTFFDKIIRKEGGSILNIRIKEIRENEGLTQEEFGKRIGAARNTIANYESGNRKPSNAVITSICREFGYREEWLRDGIEPQKPVIDEDIEYGQICAELGITDSRAKQVIMNYSKMSPKNKELFWSFISEIFESEKKDK